MTNIVKLGRIITEAKKIAFFGGAGVSTESGIPDFRSGTGLYNEPDDDGVPPETKLSHGYLTSNPEGFFSYYRKNMIYPDAKPNAAHIALAKLEAQGKLAAVITQNIDGLHQKAGSENVIELHGSTLRNYCSGCGREYGLEYIMESDGVPQCTVCGGLVRPDVVLYGEGLDSEAFTRAGEAIRSSDVLIVGGTSLTVHPAASLIRYYDGKHMIIINKTPTPYDSAAEMVIRDPIGEVFGAAIF